MGILDFEIGWERRLPDHLVATTLLEVDFVIVGSPDHQYYQAGRISPLEFAQTQFISMHPGIATPSIEEAWMEQHHLRPRTLTRLVSMDAVKRLVEADFGIAILSRLSVQRELHAGSLVQLEMDHFELRRRLLVISDSRPPRDSAREFLAFTQTYAEELEGELSPLKE